MGMLPTGRGKVLMKNCQDIAKHANEIHKKDYSKLDDLPT